MLHYSLFSSTVESLKKTGKLNQYNGKCPFHDDRHPSFSVDVETGLWICYAGCGQGNAEQFADRLGISTSIPKIKSQYSPSNIKIKGERVAALSMRYSENLSIHFDELISDLPWTKSATIDTLTGYDSEKEVFTFTHTDRSGTPINVKYHKGKQYSPHSVKGCGQNRLYPMGLMNSYDSTEPLIFCEGEKDAVTLISQGMNSCTTTTGAISLPDDISILDRFEKIYFVYDNDSAGKEGAKSNANKVKATFPDVDVFIYKWDAKYPEKWDVTDYFQSDNNADIFLEEISKRSIKLEKSSVSNMKKRDFPYTDAGNAELLAYLYQDKLRYNHSTKKWLIWNGHYWKTDIKCEVINFAIQAARKRQKDALSIEDISEKKKMLDFGVSAEYKAKLESAVGLARSIDPISTVESEWDNQPYKLQFENGSLDLKTFSFSKGNPSDMISQSVRYNYNSDADCPKWTKAIQNIMAGDAELVRYFQKVLGYSITGDISEQCFFIFYGFGANGKSVCLEVMRMCTGDYALDTPFSTFEQNKYNTQSNDLARLNGARIVSSSENSSARRLNEERLKSITGGDPITARFLHREFFSFQPQCKIVLAVNTLPQVEDNSHGFWRRVKTIPFSVCFKGESRNEHLIDELRLEKAGIINWMIEGLKLWQSEGLNSPEKVIRQSHEYEYESNPVIEFLYIYTEEKENESVASSELYRNFQDWMQLEYPEEQISQVKFTRSVKSKGYQCKPYGENRWKHFLNMRLIDKKKG